MRTMDFELIFMYKIYIKVNMETEFNQQDRDTLRRALRTLVVFLVSMLLISGSESNAAYVWELSLALALMSAFQSMFLIVKIIFVLLLLEIILPGSAIAKATSALF